MLEQPVYRLEDVEQIRRLLDEHSWMTVVSVLPTGPVVSHAPILVDDSADGVVVVGHLARADGDLHELGQHEVVVIAQGQHGYISPAFYVGGPYVPTWNFLVAHLHGRPQILSPEETYGILDRTVDRYERARTSPFRLESVAAYAHQIAPYTTGFRLVPTRVVAKAKLSQEKPQADRIGVVRGLETDDVHGNAALAAQMRSVGGLE